MSKILIISSVPPPYHGANIYAEKLLNSELNKHFELIHLNTSDHRTIDNIGKVDFINIYLALKNACELIFYIRQHKPSIIYMGISFTILPFLRDGLFILISNLFSNAKIVIHFHGGGYFMEEFYEKSSWFVKKYIELTLAKVDWVIVLGQNLIFVFNKFIKNIEVIPNGIEPPASYKSGLDRIQKNKTCFGFIGNLFEFKGVFELIQAIPVVIQEHEEAEFIIAGKWNNQNINLKKRILDFIEKSNIKNNVLFVGEVLGKEKEEFYNSIDVLIHPSVNEGQPLVILEAMSYGKPIIACKDVGAISEMVEDGINGILVQKNSHESISSAVNYLLRNKNKILEYGEFSRLKFFERFTYNEHIQKLISFFYSVIENNKV